MGNKFYISKTRQNFLKEYDRSLKKWNSENNFKAKNVLPKESKKNNLPLIEPLMLNSSRNDLLLKNNLEDYDEEISPLSDENYEKWKFLIKSRSQAFEKSNYRMKISNPLKTLFDEDELINAFKRLARKKPLLIPKAHG